ncbi:hypothetical protein AX14_013540 [Amanita brunnescens Koide BX004]|nr:hypothetical protein AX14_013540 [Amanita brunnescens Koide BX004]
MVSEGGRTERSTSLRETGSGEDEPERSPSWSCSRSQSESRSTTEEPSGTPVPKFKSRATAIGSSKFLLSDYLLHGLLNEMTRVAYAVGQPCVTPSHLAI